LDQPYPYLIIPQSAASQIKTQSLTSLLFPDPKYSKTRRTITQYSQTTILCLTPLYKTTLNSTTITPYLCSVIPSQFNLPITSTALSAVVQAQANSSLSIIKIKVLVVLYNLKLTITLHFSLHHR